MVACKDNKIKQNNAVKIRLDGRAAVSQLRQRVRGQRTAGRKRDGCRGRAGGADAGAAFYSCSKAVRRARTKAANHSERLWSHGNQIRP